MSTKKEKIKKALPIEAEGEFQTLTTKDHQEPGSSQGEGLAPLALEGVHAGFPSPAQDYMQGVVDLNKELVRHPQSTFFARVVGDSMTDEGVKEGDVLVIDKSIEASEGDMAVCFVDGEFALKRISFKDPGGKTRRASSSGHSYDFLPHSEMWLLSGNSKYPPIHITDANDFTVWGVVTYIIKKI